MISPKHNIRVASAKWQRWQLEADLRGISTAKMIDIAVEEFLKNWPSPHITR